MLTKKIISSICVVILSTALLNTQTASTLKNGPPNKLGPTEHMNKILGADKERLLCA